MMFLSHCMNMRCLFCFTCVILCGTCHKLVLCALFGCNIASTMNDGISYDTHLRVCTCTRAHTHVQTYNDIRFHSLIKSVEPIIEPVFSCPSIASCSQQLSPAQHKSVPERPCLHIKLTTAKHTFTFYHWFMLFGD